MICPICKQRRNHPAHTDACSRELQRRRKREIELGWDFSTMPKSPVIPAPRQGRPHQRRNVRGGT